MGTEMRMVSLGRIPNGHKIFYRKLLSNLSALKTESFRLDFGTPCQVFSTSWKFELVCHELTETNEMSYSVILLRDDSLSGSVEASISLEFGVSTPDRCIYPSKVFQKAGMHSGDKIEEAVCGNGLLVSTEVLRDKSVYVLAEMTFRLCH